MSTSASVDYHELLWQELSKNFAAGSDNVFVMTTGTPLLYSDYSLTHGNVKGAALKTFELTDACIGCSANYNPTGSTISRQFDQLLNYGKGPEPGPRYQAAFQQAKRALYTDFEDKEPTPLYQKYLDAYSAYKGKMIDMKFDYQDKYKDRWEARYDEAIQATSEYITYMRLEKQVGPYLKAIDDWVCGPLAGVMTPMRKAYEDNKRSVVLSDGKKKDYFDVSMIPSDWYQWFDPDQPEDGSWTKISVTQNSHDAKEARKYKKLGGSASARYGFFTIKASGSGSEENKINTGNSRGINISFKVRSVEIRRPWVDLTALKFETWKIPGLRSGAWSTGVLDSSNDGSFPLLTTQMIVAKEITVSAESFSKEIIDAVKKFDAKVNVGVIFGLFSFGGTGGGEYEKQTHNISINKEKTSITLTGTQVIGYTGTLVPKYPA